MKKIWQILAAVLTVCVLVTGIPLSASAEEVKSGIILVNAETGEEITGAVSLYQNRTMSVKAKYYENGVEDRDVKFRWSCMSESDLRLTNEAGTELTLDDRISCDETVIIHRLTGAETEVYIDLYNSSGILMDGTTVYFADASFSLSFQKTSPLYCYTNQGTLTIKTKIQKPSGSTDVCTVKYEVGDCQSINSFGAERFTPMKDQNAMIKSADSTQVTLDLKNGFEANRNQMDVWEGGFLLRGKLYVDDTQVAEARLYIILYESVYEHYFPVDDGSCCLKGLSYYNLPEYVCKVIDDQNQVIDKKPVVNVQSSNTAVMDFYYHQNKSIWEYIPKKTGSCTVTYTYEDYDGKQKQCKKTIYVTDDTYYINEGVTDTGDYRILPGDSLTWFPEIKHEYMHAEKGYTTDEDLSKTTIKWSVSGAVKDYLTLTPGTDKASCKITANKNVDEILCGNVLAELYYNGRKVVSRELYVRIMPEYDTLFLVNSEGKEISSKLEVNVPLAIVPRYYRYCLDPAGNPSRKLINNKYVTYRWKDPFGSFSLQKKTDGSCVVTRTSCAEAVLYCDAYYLEKSENPTEADQKGVEYGSVFFDECQHSYKQTITPAAEKKDGKIVKKCSKCGYSETTKIPKIMMLELYTSSYTYNGKIKTPSVNIQAGYRPLKKNTDYTLKYDSGRKNVGTYKVKVTFKGKYSGTKTLSFKINPQGTSIASLKAVSKGFVVKWKKQKTQTSGYQIRYSTNSKFKGAKTVTVAKNSSTSKKVTKLKAKKTYYVQVRTYKKIGKKSYYYSKWSKTKKVKTK